MSNTDLLLLGFFLLVFSEAIAKAIVVLWSIISPSTVSRFDAFLRRLK